MDTYDGAFPTNWDLLFKTRWARSSPFYSQTFLFICAVIVENKLPTGETFSETSLIYWHWFRYQVNKMGEHCPDGDDENTNSFEKQLEFLFPRWQVDEFFFLNFARASPGSLMVRP